jgi:hypothetical protein
VKGVKLLKEQRGENQKLCPGLTMGTALQVKVKGLGSAQSNLVGMEDGVYLIIKTPPTAEITTKLFQKNIIVRYFHAGQIFSFRSTLLGIIKEPFRLWILSYPTSVNIFNLRKHNRIYCLLPAQIKLSSGLYYGFIEDISMGGCYFELNTLRNGKFPSIKIGDEAVLFFDLQENKEKVVLNFVVLAIKDDTRTMKVGVQWKSLHVDKDAASFAAIRSYIATFRERDRSDK